MIFVESADPRGTTLLGVAVANAGMIKGAKACEVLCTWAWAVRDAGHELGDGSLSSAVREYAAFWRQSERTAWRDLARFKQGFPTEESPAALSAALLARLDAQSVKSVSRLQLEASGLLVAA